MRQIILIVGLTLFSFSIVQAQVLSGGGATRQQTIQKGKVLRKSSTHPNTYHANSGTRENTVPLHQLTDGSSRAQPMVTKPLPPVPQQ